MRSIFCTIVFFSLFQAWGQTNGVVTNSTNSNVAEPAEEEIFEFQQDSTTLDLEGVGKTRSIDRKEKKAEKESSKVAMPEAPAAKSDSYGYSSEPVPAPQSPQMTQEYQSNTSSFQLSKKMSSTQRTQRSPSVEQQNEMNEAVGYFETNAPNSFEYHYFKYVSGNYNVELIDHLQNAEALRPNNSDVQLQKAAYHIIMNEPLKALLYIQKLKASQRLPQSVVDYSSDIVRSTPENGTLITHGFDDTYGVWTAQNELGIRTDVTLVSLDFLQSQQYRDNLTNVGFKLPTDTVIDVDYLVNFCVLNSERNLSISMTTPKEYLIPLQDKLYVAGLVFEYHTETIDNFYRNEYLWENQLSKVVIESTTDEKSRQLSANYLPMLLQLRKVYHQTGEEEKLQEIDKVTDKVGVQCRKYEQVQKLKGAY